MGKIVLEDFNEGDGYYKINLAYLNKEQVEEIENLVSKWNPTDEDIKSCIAMCLTDVNEQRFKDYGTNLRDCLAWLEKQGEKPTDEEMKEVLHTEYEKGRADAFAELNQKPFDYSNATIQQKDYAEQKSAEEYNITGIGSKNAQGKLGEMIKNLKHDNEVLEQKPAWSEEDEAHINGIIDYLLDYKLLVYEEDMNVANGVQKELDWLKSLKERVQPQQKVEWSEEDERKINRIYSILGQAADTHAFSTTCRLIGDKECIELQDFLKSLKERIQPKVEWSKEDEKMCQETIDWFEKKCFPYALESENPARESINWLKSLKQRIGD